jgi:hypothetical protein
MGIFESIDIYNYLYTDIVNRITHKKYAYMNTDGYIYLFSQGFLKGNICESMQIYWREMLLRTHFAAVTSIIRNQKWISGVEFGMKSKNLMVFCASLRGLLESSVDTYYSLEQLPSGLSLNFKNINRAIKGELNQYFSSKEIEDKLIHYQFAHRGKECLYTHNALSISDYIKSADMDEKIRIKELYSALCEITHPASNSVSCFTNEIIESENNSYIITSASTDDSVIHNLASNHSNQIVYLMKLALSVSVTCLKILSLYEYSDVISEYINDCVFNKLIDKNTFSQYLNMIDKSSA